MKTDPLGIYKEWVGEDFLINNKRIYGHHFFRHKAFIQSTSEVKLDRIAGEYLVGASDYNMVCFVDVQMEQKAFLYANVLFGRETNEPRHEISNNVVCATSKGSDQPAHTRSLIRAFAWCLNIL